MVAIFKTSKARWLFPLLLVLTLIPPILLLNRQFLRANRQMDRVLDGYENIAILWNLNRLTLSGSESQDAHNPMRILARLESIKSWLATAEMDRLSRFTLLAEPRSRLQTDIKAVVTEIRENSGNNNLALLDRIDSDFLSIRGILGDYRTQLDGGFAFLVQAQVFLILLLMILVAVALDERSRQQVKLETGRRLQMEISRVQEGERNRIALDLHDDIAQELSWMRLKLAGLTPEPGILNVMDNLVSRIRDMSQSLRAPEFPREDFDSALNDIISINERRGGISVLYMPGLISPGAFPELYGHIYRVLQECLNNTRKHAGKCRVFIELQEEEDLVYCEYRDDGIGFDTNDGTWTESLGFRGIRNRMILIGGVFAIEARPGSGMKLKFQAPLRRFPHG